MWHDTDGRMMQTSSSRVETQHSVQRKQYSLIFLPRTLHRLVAKDGKKPLKNRLFLELNMAAPYARRAAPHRTNGVVPEISQG